MSARDDLAYAAVTTAPAHRVTELLDAYRAEVRAETLREAADVAKECAQSWHVVSKDSADGASYVAQKLCSMAEEVKK